MNGLRRLKQTLAKGCSIRVGPYIVNLAVSRAGTMSAAAGRAHAELNLRQVLFLRKTYPFFERLELPIDHDTTDEVLKFMLAFVPGIDPNAREVSLRNELHRLRNSTKNARLIEAATKEIARSDLRSGIPDRAKLLRDDPNLAAALERQLAQSDQAYGAAFLSRDWPNASRGSALCHYFGAHAEQLRGKRILHISPEPELRAWLNHRMHELGFTYRTSNITGDDVDMNQDLTAITATESYDLVICHRVFEHILDDRSAFRELYRIINPGGFLQISVPQSMHQEFTLEWVVPDATHHGHVRHYGRDFARRLEEAGFIVKEERWLLERPAGELIANEAYPLRMYHAYKG